MAPDPTRAAEHDHRTAPVRVQPRGETPGVLPREVQAISVMSDEDPRDEWLPLLPLRLEQALAFDKCSRLFADARGSQQICWMSSVLLGTLLK